MDVQVGLGRKTMLRVYQCRAWVKEVGSLFDAFKQYTCLQSPWFPLLKYISHIPEAPFNTEKCKETEGESLLFLFFYPYSYSRYTMIPWELPGTLRGGREQWAVLSQFYRYPVAIGVAVLVNNCFLWKNSGRSSDSLWRQVRSSFRHGTEKSSGKTH